MIFFQAGPTLTVTHNMLFLTTMWRMYGEFITPILFSRSTLRKWESYFHFDRMIIKQPGAQAPVTSIGPSREFMRHEKSHRLLGASRRVLLSKHRIFLSCIYPPWDTSSSMWNSTHHNLQDQQGIDRNTWSSSVIHTFSRMPLTWAFEIGNLSATRVESKRDGQ